MSVSRNYHGGNVTGLSPSVVDYSSNINPFGVPESFRQALFQCLENFTKYPDKNYSSLTKAIGEYLSVPSEFVYPANGAVDVIYQIAASHLFSAAIIAAPTFSEYKRAFQLAKCNTKEIPCYQFSTGQMDLSKLERYFCRHCIVIICNPNNPTGCLIPKQELISFAQKLQKIQGSLLLDEAFIEFTQREKENTFLPELEQFKNVIVVRAATKFFGLPGIRLGYSITYHSSLQNKLWENSQPWHINTAAEIGAAAFFSDTSYIARSKKWIEKERPFFFQQLNSLEKIKVYPSEANFFLVELLTKSIDAYDFFDKMKQKNFLIRIPEGFTGLGKQFFRIAIKDRETNQKLLQAISECLEDLK